MSSAPFVIKALGKEARESFDCGSDPLNQYFKTRISQDVKRQLAGAFIAVEHASGRIAGFYTLSAAHVALGDLNEDWLRKLPRYPTVPAVLIGRLAIDTAFQGAGLGAALLADAVLRTLRSDIAAHMLMVDAKDDTAAAFYQHHGMRRAPDQTHRLFVPLSILAAHLGLKRS